VRAQEKGLAGVTGGRCAREEEEKGGATGKLAGGAKGPEGERETG
jgi:hypothetical protein